MKTHTKTNPKNLLSIVFYVEKIREGDTKITDVVYSHTLVEKTNYT